MPCYKSKAFTLIEVLVVLVIIGVLVTLTGATILNARSRAVDVKRLAEVKHIQYALDAFARDHGGEYPEDQEFIVGGALVSRNGYKVYLASIPHNPTPRADGGCPDSDYLYHQGTNGYSYTLVYCLAGKVSDLTGGSCTAMPSAVCVQNITCSCSDIAKTCCGYCNSGDTCNGTTLP